MRHDWILDVLTDMRAYAERNGLQRLVGALDDVIPLARAEVAASENTGPAGDGKAD
jgi:hypothetical protein